MEQQYDDTFLARWMSGELSAEELQEFEKSEDYMKYVQIVETLETAEIPEFNLEDNFQATLEKITLENSKKKKRVIPLWSYGIAASIAIIFFVYSFFFASTTFTTEFAEQTNFELPDGSQVNLNAGSSISYKKYNWKSNRKLDLEGEAFFKVEKGSTFTVNTNQGSVTVLGTQFIVNSREDFYNVICYEGKVKVVTAQKDSVILTKGKAFRIIKDTKENYQVDAIEPSWLSNQSNFKNTPIELVIEEIERQYNIEISGKENLKSANFTGSFTHTNIEQALAGSFYCHGNFVY